MAGDPVWKAPQDTTPKARRPLPRARRPIPYKSDKRAEQADERDRVRAQVLARDGGCVARDVITEVRCGSPNLRRPALEVDEVRGGSWRITEWLDARRCWSLCQNHHDHKTVNKLDVLRRMRAAGRLSDDYTVKGS